MHPHRSAAFTHTHVDCVCLTAGAQPISEAAVSEKVLIKNQPWDWTVSTFNCRNVSHSGFIFKYQMSTPHLTDFIYRVWNVFFFVRPYYKIPHPATSLLTEVVSKSKRQILLCLVLKILPRLVHINK